MKSHNFVITELWDLMKTTFSDSRIDFFDKNIYTLNSLTYTKNKKRFFRFFSQNIPLTFLTWYISRRGYIP